MLIRKALIIVLLSMVTTACFYPGAGSYNRKNLDDYLSQSIGGITYYLTQDKDFKKNQKLPNGNMAYHHRLNIAGPSKFYMCDMYFEVDQKTNKIIGYTFTDEHADRDCKMVLR